MTQILKEAQLPPSLRFLKALVIVLMLCMIGGVITVSALLVTRLRASEAPIPALPAQLNLPDGAKAQAVTMGKGWIAVVTDQDEILIFSAEGQLRQSVALHSPD